MKGRKWRRHHRVGQQMPEHDGAVSRHPSARAAFTYSKFQGAQELGPDDADGAPTEKHAAYAEQLKKPRAAEWLR